MTHLQELYDAVKAGQSRPKLEDAADLAFAHGPLSGMVGEATHGNTQAAIDFVQAVLPGWKWTITNDAACLSMCEWVHVEGNPARALLLAALAAMIAKGEG